MCVCIYYAIYQKKKKTQKKDRGFTSILSLDANKICLLFIINVFDAQCIMYQMQDSNILSRFNMSASINRQLNTVNTNLLD